MANTSGWFEPATDKARQEAEDCGRLVEIVRNEEGLTRAQLASAADVPEEDVTLFESGRVSPVEPMLTTLLRAMGRTA
ncbi:helix-turn-helix domain-containing protein [Actinophytocola algeriensis]|jgi:DNA-binding XRE family transcriptional regulator|uniref:DNA-binding XRE family transcriptional regulator n=1 Tax=Actinophytocola algeriensis TaxID=1768010 RepID=A0A7W7Q4Q3_9PSEU|nr:helix-turn-helix transcriptional regulator [Actinophytocola algeriensis]MBB4906798.1 DNA-binding XRE family transcriptional regulator [Actinophytocola algeriensis]MBE1478279.1 DNA-binding XRE family transcriptional regulator [Actinophytocola algeriensis]